MALIYADRVKEVSSTTGTGDMTLGGAPQGFQTFTAAMSDSDTCHYMITDDTDWEVGLGTFNGGVLARTTVHASSNADAAVDWQADTNVSLVNSARSISDLLSDVAANTAKNPYPSADATKLAGISAGATANDTDANLLNRTNHTGAQAISTVSGLQSALDGKAASSHTHTASEITDFDTEVAGNSAVTANTAKNSYPLADATKLSGIETGATADQTDSEIVAAVDAELGNTDWKTRLTTEEVQDIIGAMFSSGSHTGASVNYNDANGTINVTVTGGGGSSLTQEEVEDFVGGLVQSGTGINVNYDDAGGVLSIALAGEDFTTALKNKLDGIAAGATANDADANLRDRSTHTGSQAISTVTGLQAAIDAKANSNHTHTTSQITDFNLGVSANTDVSNNTVKLSGIEPGATADQTDAEIVSAIDAEIGNTDWKAPRTNEYIQDLVAAMFSGASHTNVTVTYNDTSGTLSIASSGGGGGPLTQEEVEDIVGALMQPGAGVDVTYNDSGNAISIALSGEEFTAVLKNKLDGIAASATANDTDANLRNRANHTGSQAISTVTGLQTALDSKASDAHTHLSSDLTDFASSVSSNSAVAANTAKNSYPSADAVKLSLISDEATANDTDANLKTRSNHTGNETMAVNERISMETSEPTSTASGLIRLKFDDQDADLDGKNKAKAIIAYIDENDNEVIWLQAHNWLDASDQHKHFSIEAADAAGLKQTRLGVGYGADNVEIQVNQADLKLYRNSGMANGNLFFTGLGGGGNIQHDNALKVFPGGQAVRGFQIDDDGSNTVISALGASVLKLNDSLDITGDITVSGTVDGRDVAADGAVIDGLHAVASSGDYNDLSNKPDLTLNKSATVENPTSSEDLTLFRTDVAITIQELVAVVVGSSTPSVTINIRHSTDRSAVGNSLTASAIVITNTDTGSSTTSFSDATIPANSWVWLETTAQSGTVDSMSLDLRYTED